MSCDFSTYNALRDATRNAANEAAASCTAVEVAQAALVDAQATLDAAQADKAMKYDEWERAEKAENAEATRLGINPTPVTP